MNAAARSASGLSLDLQRQAFASRRFLAMPLAGTIAWSFVAVCGALLPTGLAMWALYLATGSIAYLGILLMWLPLSWILRHWIGLAHALARTALVIVAWYAWPDARFVAVPLVIVGTYVFTIAVLERRWRSLPRDIRGPEAAAA